MGLYHTLSNLLSAVGSVASILVVLVLVIAVPTSLGCVVLGPINRVAGRLKAPTRFFLSDFLWLVVQLQLALAYCGQFVGVQQRIFYALMLGFLTLATVALWAGAVSFLSRAEVTDPKRRAVFILFLLPVSLALMMLITLLLLAAVVTAVGGLEFSAEYRREVEIGYRWLGLGRIGIAGGLMMLPAVGYLLRRVSRWVVAEPNQAAVVAAAGGELVVPAPLAAGDLTSASG